MLCVGSVMRQAGGGGGGGGVLVFNGAGLVSDVDIGWDAGSTFLTVM